MKHPRNTSDTIVEELTINGPAERVFEALVNPRATLAVVRWSRAIPRDEHGVGSMPRR